MAVQEPRTRIVRLESNRNVIARFSDAHNVADDGVVIVVRRITSAANDVECVSVQVDGVLQFTFKTTIQAPKSHVNSPAHQY
jgi:hypothetical protein